MKRLLYLFAMMLVLVSCKKDHVDATTTKSFQESINDMASSLNTLQQVKFSEALYILKTFGVEGENDIVKLKNLGQMLNGMKVPAILSMADQVAQKNGVAWTSTGPPSLGEMDIFGTANPEEHDPNDIKASSLSLQVLEINKDSILGAKALQVVPRLVDGSGKPIQFSQAALETVLEVFNNGTRLLTSKNLMLDNNFKGFTVNLNKIDQSKVPDGKLDITVTVKSTNKAYKMSKVGMNVNPNALRVIVPVDPSTVTDPSIENPEGTTPETSVASTADPKSTVSKFLSNLNAQNFKGAYDTSDNPNWGNFDNFSNQTSGFGGVKSVSVKNIGAPTVNGNSSSVNATYDVKDKDGKTTSLNVTFGLKNVNGEWKISSYKIN